MHIMLATRTIHFFAHPTQHSNCLHIIFKAHTLRLIATLSRLFLQNIAVPGLTFFDQLSTPQACPPFTFLRLNALRKAHKAVYTPTRNCFVRIRDICLCTTHNSSSCRCRKYLCLASCAPSRILIRIAYGAGALRQEAKLSSLDRIFVIVIVTAATEPAF